MRPQRVRDGAIRMEMQAVKWTAEGTVKGISQYRRVFCDVEAYVSCRECEGTSQRAWVRP